MELLDGDISKVITKANNLDDNLIVLNLIKFAKKKIVTFTMGDFGIFSRVFSPLFGAYFTFVSLDSKTAPGQINIKNYRSIQNKFQKFKD